MNGSYLVIGLGSMGKRRVRCLTSLGIKPENIIGTDSRTDRLEEAASRYGIRTVSSIEDAPWEELCAVIVSLPPHLHTLGVAAASEHGLPVFIEASVLSSEIRKEMEYTDGKIFAAPSCTFLFHPMIRRIQDILSSGRYGKVCNFSYHSGQYLPDWHPWEKVTDFYVSRKETGGAREIVPYELTWMTQVFGFPKEIKGYYRKTLELGCDIDDTYSSVLDYGDMLGMLTVDVASRYGVRSLIINLEKATLQWRWDTEKLEVYDALTRTTSFIEQPVQPHEDGYNANIGEQMYIDEIRAFLDGINDPSAYPTTLESDLKVVGLLEELEASDRR